MESLKELLRDGELYDDIKLGKCGKCGKEYALINGSNRTAFRNGKRYAEIGNPAKHGWGAFRCGCCKEVIENTWVETTSPTV